MWGSHQGVCVQRDTYVEKRTFLQWLQKRSNPGLIVNLCFLVVLIFSTLLTWREVVVLEGAYIASQRNHLETVASSLDRQLQFSVDKLLFFRHGMNDALHMPLSFNVLHDAVSRFQKLRTIPAWQLAVDKDRTLPINGVSDEFVEKTTLLNRDDTLTNNELSAALELGYLLRLGSNTRREERIVYVSRAGFYVATDTASEANDIVPRYYQLVTQQWFTQQSERENRSRAVRWFISPPSTWTGNEQAITASVPIYYDHHWYGVVAMDFSLKTMQRLLRDATSDRSEGEYQLYDTRLNLIASSANGATELNRFDQPELAQIASAIAGDTHGSLRLGSRFVSWERLDHFDGVMLRVHTLHDGVRGDFGSISIVLALLWALFSAMLLISWLVIRRMVSNMYALQSTLQWQAWHDPLTRLNNRGALFERAKILAKKCEQQLLPYSVIQIDLDHFKSINDRFGHEAGDQVIKSVATIIQRAVHDDGLAFRYGGEEFLALLTGADETAAHACATAIYNGVRALSLRYGLSEIGPVDVSIGIASYPQHAQSDNLLRAADVALYRAKELGRSRIVSFGMLEAG